MRQPSRLIGSSKPRMHASSWNRFIHQFN